MNRLGPHARPLHRRPRSLLHLCWPSRYRYYSAFIAAKVMALDDTRDDAGAHEVRRRELLPDEALGALRPSLRGDRRRRTARRAGARRAVRLGARLHLARRRRAASPAPSTTRSRCGPRRAAAAARWPRSRAPKSARVAGITAAIAILFILVIALAGLGIVVVNALAESAWGTFTIGVTIPHRACSWASTCSSGARDRSRKRRSSASR